MIRLATSPEPHAVRASPSVLTMFSATHKTSTQPYSLHAPRPEPEPNPEPNPEPDTAVSAQHDEHAGITVADWDELFHAVIARLQACAGVASKEHAPEHRLGAVASLQVTVQECVASLNWLHAALPRERQQHQLHQSAH